MPSFSRLVRFLARDGRTYYGDAILPRGVTDISKARQAHIIKGDIFGKHDVTDQVVDIRTLLAPLAPEDVRTVRCLGLNYAAHAKESKMPIPQYPVVFYKPATSLTGPSDPIPVHPMAQQHTGLDYECELVAVIGKPCSDVPESRALDYVLGYAVGNDVSHRDWQLKLGGGQWSLGKGFDGWAPWGPGIVSRSVIQDPQALAIRTRVNGQTMQESTTADMIFGVAKTIAFLSQGTTLMPGDLIFTGTPQGVGMGRNPQVWLKDGDVVEVELEGVGTCTNKVEFSPAREAKL
ncbi:Fumarylacetoacetase-like protein [Thermothelomyces thermophilus ATCC 42464]|uniref:Fumarylacetoacetase-like protein n=1 Tax=Thermothelomyces thermophilus (strain ATCC 42464 / BCRC 31852 / DSM 1799) TaxID=573729 RepID=G2Q6B4_THET4|nr:Fumarylacetoacetase-like protein [Thermothelomyces thermophilus ATCC 42464]AEO53884.1 Fumarylacetoacetase-like protein [Thermothelomyces thermophilus ATCC 42464]